MISNLRPYREMEDSGVEWLGRVPKHWDVRRTKSLLSRNDSGVWGSDFDDDGVIVLRSTEQTVDGEWSIVAPAKRRLTPSEYSACRLEEGDLLVTKSSGSPLHIGKTSVVTKDIADSECCFSNFMQRLRATRDVMPRFLWYVFNGDLGRSQLDCYSDTTTGLANLNREIIGNVTLAAPPLVEQSAIVCFLDHVNRRVRRYIRTKQNLIALLEEQKQTIFHQAVTGEFNAQSGQPYGAYKQSGIKWLREVPQHWEERALSTVVSSIQTGPFGSQLHAGEYVHGGIPVINPSHMRTGTLVPDPAVSASKTKAGELSRHYLSPGDIVMARRGEVGRCALITQKEAGWICGTGSLRIRPIVGMFEPRYLLIALSAGGVRDTLTLTSIGATMDNINAGMVSQLRIYLPPISEQMAIVDFVDKAKTHIDEAIDFSLREVKLLREYWSALVAKAVTGVIDVRDVADVLPEVNPLDSISGLNQAVDVCADSDFHELDARAEVVGK